MNRGEATGVGLIGGLASVVTYYIILYMFIFDNLLVVAKQTGYDLYSVESEVWWLMIGFGLILGLRAITKTHKYFRRNFCEHCGKENKH